LYTHFAAPTGSYRSLCAALTNATVVNGHVERGERHDPTLSLVSCFWAGELSCSCLKPM